MQPIPGLQTSMSSDKLNVTIKYSQRLLYCIAEVTAVSKENLYSSTSISVKYFDHAGHLFAEDSLNIPKMPANHRYSGTLFPASVFTGEQLTSCAMIGSMKTLMDGATDSFQTVSK